MEPKLRHFSHKHTLFLKTKLDENDETVSCFVCTRPISVPYYACDECSYYFLHNICARLPRKLKHPEHPEHPLTLHAKDDYYCDLCMQEKEGFAYKCSVCEYNAGLDCTYKLDKLEENKCHQNPSNPTYLSSSFHWHVHPLVLMPEVYKTEKSSEDLVPSFHELLMFKKTKKVVLEKLPCDGCSEPILGPTYRCEFECGFNLHKACAELPIQINLPMHSKHPLTLLHKPHSSYGRRSCIICSRKCDKFFYKCQQCKFYVDLICASTSHQIHDKCHTDPLIPIQISSSFLCHICLTREEGVSYKCTTCPFWVHQNCTLLPTIIKHEQHVHELTLLSAIPSECHINFNYNCDICHRTMATYESSFSCVGCLFFAHPSCAMSLDIQPLLIKDYVSEDDSKIDEIINLPEGIEWKYLQTIVEKRGGFVSGTEIGHLSHSHKLRLQEEVGEQKICEACVLPISNPSYGCTQCNYFLHIWCASIATDYYVDSYLYFDDSYGDHPIQLRENPETLDFFRCKCCLQLCNGFGYQCSEEGCDFILDVKCFLVPKKIKHQAHQHNLTKTTDSMSTCNACSTESPYKMKCNYCSFILCHYCAMLPPIINHRHCEHGLGLQYSPVENYNLEYICDFCEKALLPKHWFYHCSKCELFAHPTCLTETVGGSNIKYGKRYLLPDHEHELTLTSFMHNWSRCKVCSTDLNRGFAVGFECGTCEFKIHLKCVKSFDKLPGMECTSRHHQYPHKTSAKAQLQQVKESIGSKIKMDKERYGLPTSEG